MPSENGRFSLFLSMCPRRNVDNHRVTKTENGSDLTLYGPPFFCTSAGRGHAVRLFYFRCSGLNDRDLSIFPGNGEFSVFVFRRIKSADSQVKILCSCSFVFTPPGIIGSVQVKFHSTENHTVRYAGYRIHQPMVSWSSLKQ